MTEYLGQGIVNQQRIVCDIKPVSMYTWSEIRRQIKLCIQIRFPRRTIIVIVFVLPEKAFSDHSDCLH